MLSLLLLLLLQVLELPLLLLLESLVLLLLALIFSLLLSFLHLSLVTFLEALTLLVLLPRYALLFLLMLPLEIHFTGALPRSVGAVRVDIANLVFDWVTLRPQARRLRRGRPVLAERLILLGLRSLLSRLDRTLRLTPIGANEAFNGYGFCGRRNDSHRISLPALGLRALHLRA